MAKPSHPKRLHPQKSKPRVVQAAIKEMLLGLGCELTGDLRHTPARVTRLWTDYLLAGQDTEPATVLNVTYPSRSPAPVSLFDVDVHLVCPHHLTVAFGRAHLAYQPNQRIAGLGSLARLIRACTARLVLQEEAACSIATALVDHLAARAAVAVIDAQHPCHSVPHGRSHRARMVTWGQAGHGPTIKSLRGLLLPATRPRPRVAD